MDPLIVSIDSTERAPTTGLRRRELWRLMQLAWPYRGMIFTGLIFTVFFAATHTVSLAGIYPVLTALLAEEGLTGGVHRKLAGERLGAELGPIGEPEGAVVRVLSVRPGGGADQAGIQAGDGIGASGGGPGADFLAEVTRAPDGAAVDVAIHPLGGGNPSLESVPLKELDPAGWVLREAVRLVPPSAETSRLRTVVFLMLGVIALVIVANIFRYFGEILLAKAILRSMMDLRARLYERTLKLPMSYFANQSTSDVITRFVQDVQEIQRGMLTLFGKMIREPMRAAFILGAAFLFDWRVTLIMVVVAPVALLVFIMVGRQVKKANTKLLQAYGIMIGALTSSLQNLRIVKAYTAEDLERQRLTRVDQKVFDQQYRLARLQAFISPLIETLAVLGTSVVVIWLATLLVQGKMDIARFGTLGLILAALFDPLRKLTDVYVRIRRSSSGAERIFAVIDQPVEEELCRAELEVGPLQEALEFRGVTFRYPGAGEPALRNVNLRIGRGEKIAIVGANGSGKTTLASLLPRLFEPEEGAVLYDGVNIRRVSLTSLRRQIGLVTQEAVIFEGSPADNIAYGSNGSHRGGVEEAARQASADEFIRALAGGFDEKLGERGMTLSGGQRQRLAIARAIFRNAPIVIFDEATSQVDTESEQKIQQALRDFSQGRTTIIIAHRLSTIQFADRVVVMEAGRIVDQGEHQELIRRCSIYQRICETQLGGAASESTR